MYVLLAQGRVAEAEPVARDLLPKSQAFGDEYYIALASTALGAMAFVKGDLDGALEMEMRGFLSNHAMGDVASLTLSLRTAAALLSVAGLPTDAVTIDAAYEAHRRRYGVRPPLDVEDWMGLSSVAEEVRAVAAREEFEESVRLGASMTTDGVIEFLVREVIPRFKARPREAARPGAAC
jgi:hypothetical protein